MKPFLLVLFAFLPHSFYSTLQLMTDKVKRVAHSVVMPSARAMTRARSQGCCLSCRPLPLRAPAMHWSGGYGTSRPFHSLATSGDACPCLRQAIGTRKSTSEPRDRSGPPARLCSRASAMKHKAEGNGPTGAALSKQGQELCE